MQSNIPSQMHLRRAITPSPEKSIINSTRRAITPTPNRNTAVGDYQNLSVIQNKIFKNEEASYVTRKELEKQQNMPESVDCVDGMRPIKDGLLNQSAMSKPHAPLHRSLSAESTQMQDGLSIPEHLNQPRRRDSGNWSGDRNSASSSSSTTLEGSYHLYLMGKRNGSHPPSPTRSSSTNGCSPVPSNASSNNSGQPQQHFFDAGYDSYSLSSTDSYPPKVHSAQQLAQIPESVVLSGDCERLCKEADQLLEKSRYCEDVHDLETALVLCNTAASKARAAMDAPYSNPHTMTFARMKHNTCVMRARSLHRRLLIEKGGNMNPEFLKDPQYVSAIDMRNMVNSIGSGSLRHNRQNGKDAFLAALNASVSNKSIEIYATLPKKSKSPLKLLEAEEAIEAAEIQSIAPPETKKPEREGRTLSIFGRGRKNEEKEKRSRSEDRNKHAREFSVAGEQLANAKDTLKKHKEDKDEKCDKEKTNKKQHKVRRKILMGGLIRRKNRSMPDLTEGNAQEADKDSSSSAKPPITMISSAVDDSSIALSTNTDSTAMSGYLSEGHFEYQTIITGNPNLERSKLMRKNVQNGAATRQQLTQVKVPPPPPLRTNSTLSQQQLQLHQQQMEKEFAPMISPIQPFHQANVSLISNMSSNTSMSEDSCQTIITTCAQVHQEQSPQQKQQIKDSGVDEVDSRYETNLDLPPYPSPPASSCHSRQASEEFPPPPNELLESSAGSGDILSQKSLDTLEGTTSILAQLQQRQQMLKQQKIMVNNKAVFDQKSVRDLAARFEQVKLPYGQNETTMMYMQNGLSRSNSSSQEILNEKPLIRTQMNGLLEVNPRSILTNDSSNASHDEVDCVPNSMHKNGLMKSASAPYLVPSTKSPYELPPSQIAEEIREVEMLNNVVNQTLNGYQNGNNGNNKPQERTKKKSVSFCDQVILVATADDDEDDDFIPNPILERVLRTANYGNGIDVVDSKVLQQQQLNIMRLQNEPSNRQQIVVPLQGSSNESNYRQDLRSEAQKQMMMAQQRLPISQNQTAFIQDIGLIESTKAMMNGNQIPMMDHQRAQIYHHVPNMPQPQQQQPIQRTIQMPHVDMNGNPSPYMQVPHPHMQQNVAINFLKNQQRPGNNFPIVSPPASNTGVYQLPPNAKFHQQQMHSQMNGNGNNFMMHQQQQMYQMPSQQQQQQQFNGISPYQRVPLSHNMNTPIQHYPQMQNGQVKPQQKKVSFEPGTKGESDINDNVIKPNGFPPTNGKMTIPSSDSPTQMTVTAIPTRVFNNSAIVKASAKAVQCNLCRKKHVIAPAIYCSDCEFYMSRFQPRV